MTRQLDNWISSYIEYMGDTEHPTAYHIWNAIACMAGILQRRVYMEWGMQTIYPNMYIFLIGRSGLGKGESMKPVIELFETTKFPLAAESITTAELIVTLNGEKSKFLQNGTLTTHASVTIFAKELSVLLGQKDLKKIAYLTDWYDSPDRWQDSTKTQGKYIIENLCLNILGASASDWFESILPAESIGGGFTSRVIFIVEHEKAKIIPKPIYTNWHRKLKKSLIEDLKEIKKIQGLFQFNTEAYDAYALFYTKQEEDIKKNIWPVKDPTFAGYTNRRTLHLRKLSIIFAASRGSKGEIILSDFEKAVLVLKNAESKMPRLFGEIGSSNTGIIINNVLEYLTTYSKVTKSRLLRIFYKDIDSSNIEVIENTLVTMEAITATSINNNHDVEYKLIPNWEDK